MGITAKSPIDLRWTQQYDIGAGGWFRVYLDDRDGVIDYERPVNVDGDIEAWPGEAADGGFGMDPFGLTAFGTGVGGPGFGMGAFGMGSIGQGVGMLEYHTPALADGDWTVAVVGYDAAGNAQTPATIEKPVTLAGPPGPPSELAVVSYNKETDTLTVEFDLSEDDEG